MSWLSEVRISCRQKIGEFPYHQIGNFVIFLNYPNENTEDEIRLLQFVIENIEPIYINMKATPHMLNTIVNHIHLEIQKLFAQQYAYELNNQLVFKGVSNENCNTY